MNGTVARLPQAVNTHSIPLPSMIAHPTTDALCSMNGFVKIGRHETRDHQCTGRGATPDEAAANYFGCLDALEAGYAARAARQAVPAPLASRTQRLSLLLACGLEKATQAEDWKLVERLIKAAALVLAGRVVQSATSGHQVRSQTEPETTVYEVAGRRCTCQDAKKHEGETPAHLCKHALAACFTVRLATEEAAHA